MSHVGKYRTYSSHIWENSVRNFHMSVKIQFRPSTPLEYRNKYVTFHIFFKKMFENCPNVFFPHSTKHFMPVRRLVDVHNYYIVYLFPVHVKELKFESVCPSVSPSDCPFVRSSVRPSVRSLSRSLNLNPAISLGPKIRLLWQRKFIFLGMVLLLQTLKQE